MNYLHRRSASLYSLLATLLVPACGASPDQGGTPDAGGAVDATPGCPAPTKGPTQHSGSVDRSELWTADGSPHVVTGELQVRNGATLTIEPCATVLFAPKAGLVLGRGGEKLVARGTADRPIAFRAREAAPWATIEVSHPGRAELAHVTISGGGEDKFRPGALSLSADSQTPVKPVLLVEKVRIVEARGHGVFTRYNGGFDPASSDLVITGSGTAEAPYPVRLTDGAMGSLPPGTYTGNMRDEILVEPETINRTTGVQENLTVRDRGVPYRIAGLLRVTEKAPGGAPAVLTLEPGVKLRFEKGRSFDVGHATSTPAGSGVLVAEGTADKPVVLTSAATPPAAGDWTGIFYKSRPRPENKLSHVRIEYAGGACQCTLLHCPQTGTSNSAIIISADTPPAAFITNTTIAHSAGNGILRGWIGTGGPDFTATNTFTDVAACRQTNPPDENKSCRDIPPCQ